MQKIDYQKLLAIFTVPYTILSLYLVIDFIDFLIDISPILVNHPNSFVILFTIFYAFIVYGSLFIEVKLLKNIEHLLKV